MNMCYNEVPQWGATNEYVQLGEQYHLTSPIDHQKKLRQVVTLRDINLAWVAPDERERETGALE